MFGSQSLQRPFGVSTFGSAIIRIEPDLASIRFAVSRLEQRPKEAFGRAHEAARSVQTYISQAKINEVSSSRVTLTQTFKYVQSEQKFIGYTATIAYHLLLRDLNRVEEILIGLTDAGVNEINAVDYQTSRLKEIRAQARQQAVKAAREKAENYCQAAGTTLGPVIHIEDINPDQLRGREGHVLQELQPDDGGPVQAFNPGSITVAGAVMVAFELGRV